jgi:hypothetical protein
MDTYQVGPDVSVISDCHEVPGIGYIPVNAFVLHAREPVVVDTEQALTELLASFEPKPEATA